MPKILIVEDEEDLAGAIKDWLTDEYHTAQIVGDGAQALSRLESEHYDLVVLDLMLPEIDGMEVCRRYRSAGGNTPILMLTAKSTLAAKEAGLDAGADDYLTKPFELRELSARVRALLRRQPVPIVSEFKVGDLCLERNSCRVTKAGQELHLLPKEFALLELLMRHTGHVLSVDDLINRVWGAESNVVPETVRSYIKMLRKKIDNPGENSIIRTVHGVGYRLEAR